MKKKLLISATSLVIIVALMGLTAGLFYFGVLHINNPSKRKYPIRGVDVAHYQGVVDWGVLSKEDISFAYIKATEGSSSVDEQFENKDKLLTELGAFLDEVETCYSMKPVIYTTEEWLPVIQERLADYDVWIRNVYGKPDPSINWTFWQYSNRHVLSGYSGTERYIDMNVFYGDEETFSAFN